MKLCGQKQKIESGIDDNRDIIAMAKNDSSSVVQVFFIRNGRMTGREHFFLKCNPDTTESEILSSFVKQYYSGTPFVPQELFLDTEIEDMELIEQWLSEIKGRKVKIVVPKIGQKNRLILLAKENARITLNQDSDRIKRQEEKTVGAVREIEELIGLTGIERMEAFDISNISGFENVGSMVVFEKGSPKRSDYRKFKIKSVTGPNDYACMEEVLTRRFKHGLKEAEGDEDADKGRFNRFPDLILMDGGRGQVNIALNVLESLSLSIPVCGMVKDDNHRTRGLYYNNIEIPIDRKSEGFKLITRIQDEAHRFAITFHRSLRNKDQVRSCLDEIPGVGPARRKALMRGFENIDEIKNATIDDLVNKAGLSRSVAESVYSFFHKDMII